MWTKYLIGLLTLAALTFGETDLSELIQHNGHEDTQSQHGLSSNGVPEFKELSLDIPTYPKTAYIEGHNKVDLNSGHYYNDDEDGPSEYQFNYGVHDDKTKDIKSQSESRHGDVVKGRYELIDSDGYKRVVEYTADDKNGFQAVVHRVKTDVVVPIPVFKYQKLKAAVDHVNEYSNPINDAQLYHQNVNHLNDQTLHNIKFNDDIPQEINAGGENEGQILHEINLSKPLFTPATQYEHESDSAESIGQYHRYLEDQAKIHKENNNDPEDNDEHKLSEDNNEHLLFRSADNSHNEDNSEGESKYYTLEAQTSQISPQIYHPPSPSPSEPSPSHHHRQRKTHYTTRLPIHSSSKPTIQPGKSFQKTQTTNTQEVDIKTTVKPIATKFYDATPIRYAEPIASLLPVLQKYQNVQPTPIVQYVKLDNTNESNMGRHDYTSSLLAQLFSGKNHKILALNIPSIGDDNYNQQQQQQQQQHQLSSNINGNALIKKVNNDLQEQQQKQNQQQQRYEDNIQKETLVLKDGKTFNVETNTK